MLCFCLPHPCAVPIIPTRTTLTCPQAATEQIIKNLQRENAMITTAWYDLTSRLQSNHVVLQRRHDAPRSWLNKQRQMVNGELTLSLLSYLFFSSYSLVHQYSHLTIIATPRR